MEILSVSAEASQVVPARWRMTATLVVTFDLTASKCCLKDSVELDSEVSWAA